MWRNRLVVALVFVLSAGNLFSQKKEPVDYVNTIIGASTSAKAARAGHGLGKTFPGAATPFGLVQLSPDTITGGDNGPGYSWHMSSIEGFSFTHMSGIGWYGDLGNFLVTPTTGELRTSKGTPPKEDFGGSLQSKPIKGYRSNFSKDTEVTKAGYYAVTLDDYDIRVELTAAPRAGMMRMTFPKHEQSRVQFDLARRVGGTSTEEFIEVVNKNTIRGWIKCDKTTGGWGNGAGNPDYTVYFYCQLSKPFAKFGIWEAEIPEGVSRKNEANASIEYQELIAAAKVFPMKKTAQGKHIGFYTEFPTKDKEQVLLKAGISFVSMENAEENLKANIPQWNFDSVVKTSRKMWNDALGVMNVAGGTEREKTIFYTALYHTMIDPRAFSDQNGQYIGADKQIHKADKFTYRTIFSGWDVFRSAFPLFTVIRPDIIDDEINSWIQMAELSGRKYFDRWEFLNAYSGCMIGNPAVSVIADAYVKGIRNYDVDKAYEFAANTNKRNSNRPRGYRTSKHSGVSETLEHAYSEWCMGVIASALGKKAEAADFFEHSKAYKNIWDTQVNWFRLKDDNGNWTEWKDKLSHHNQGCVESNNFQQGWFVPHDIPGLKALMGDDFFDSELELFFDKTPEDFLWNDYYNHPNEPNHQVPFMLNYTKKPYLTQKWTRKICDKAYGDDVFGIVGNEDVGQMSAWYVLAAAGFHPVCPGSTRYEITSPVFEKIEIKLDSKYYKGKTFEVIAYNNSSKNIYIQSLKLNGKQLDRLWIDHSEIVNGGRLEMQMGPNPNPTLGIGKFSYLK